MSEALPQPIYKLVVPGTQHQTATETETVFKNAIVVNGITYPLFDGMAGQSITTNGAGTLGFEYVTADSSTKTQNMSSILGETTISGLTIVGNIRTDTYTNLNTEIGSLINKTQNISLSVGTTNISGKTSIENIIQEVQKYTGVGPHDLSVNGKINNIVTHSGSSVVNLPLTPVDGFITRVINHGSGSVTVHTKSPNIIETLGTSIELLGYLDKSTFLFIDNVWNLI
jgi:hypothetical protein